MRAAEGVVVSELVELALDSKGRATVPKSLRERAGITEGSVLLMYEEDGRIIIDTRDLVRERVRRAAADTDTGDAVADVRAQRDADRQRSDAAAAQRHARSGDPDAGQQLLDELGL